MKENQKLYLGLAIAGLLLLTMYLYGSEPSLPVAPGGGAPFGMATHAVAKQSEFFRLSVLPSFMASNVQQSVLGSRFVLSPENVVISPDSPGKLNVGVKDSLIAPFGLVVMPPFHYSVFMFEGARTDKWVRTEAKTQLRFFQLLKEDKMKVLIYSCTKKKIGGWDCHNNKWQSKDFKLTKSICQADVCTDDRTGIVKCDNGVKRFKLCADGYLCNRNSVVCEPSVIPPPPMPSLPPGFVDTCIDTDGGVNAGIKGMVKTKENEDWDFCLKQPYDQVNYDDVVKVKSGMALMEHYCDGDKWSASVINCVGGCNDGSCVEAVCVSDGKCGVGCLGVDPDCPGPTCKSGDGCNPDCGAFDEDCKGVIPTCASNDGCKVGCSPLDFDCPKSVPGGCTEGGIFIDGDVVEVTRKGDRLDSMESLGDVRDVLTVDDLSALSGGNIMNSSFRQELRFAWKEGDTVSRSALSIGENGGPVIHGAKGEPMFEFALTFDPPIKSKVVGEGVVKALPDYVGEVVNILGHDFTITDATIVPQIGSTHTSKLKFVLLGKAVRGKLKQGESNNYVVGGTPYPIKVLHVANDVKFLISGIEYPPRMGVGDEYRMNNGVRLVVTKISDGAVEFFLGWPRLEIEDKFTDDSFSGAVVEQWYGGDNSMIGELSVDKTIFTLNSLRLRSDVKAKTGDLYVAPGQGIRKNLKSPMSMLVPGWDIYYYGLVNDAHKVYVAAGEHVIRSCEVLDPCSKFSYGDCPEYCTEQCVSSSCNGTICTDDCGGPGSCQVKKSCYEFDYNSCPANCNQVCVPTDCKDNVCDYSCSGQGSCVPKTTS